MQRPPVARGSSQCEDQDQVGLQSGFIVPSPLTKVSECDIVKINNYQWRTHVINIGQTSDKIIEKHISHAIAWYYLLDKLVQEVGAVNSVIQVEIHH